MTIHIILYSHQQWMKFPVSWHPYQLLVLPVFWILVILSCMSWCLSVVFSCISVMTRDGLGNGIMKGKLSFLPFCEAISQVFFISLFCWSFLSGLLNSRRVVLFVACQCANSLQSYLTLCDPMDCSPPGSNFHVILQARILEWLAMPSSR